MKRLLVGLLGLALLALSASASAESYYHGHIVQAGTLGNGDVFVEFSEPVGPPSCSSVQIRVANSSPAAKAVLSIAIASFMAGTRVYVQTDGCHGVYGTLTTANSWFYPKP